MTLLNDSPEIIEKLGSRTIDAHWSLGDDPQTGERRVLLITAVYFASAKRYEAGAASVVVERGASLSDGLSDLYQADMVRLVERRSANYSDETLWTLLKDVIELFRDTDGERQLAGFRHLNVGRATTKQRERIAQRLREGFDVKMMYPDRHSGKAILDQLRRYLDTEEANKIDDALYTFLMSVGFIAHYSLHGFRHAYTEPFDLIDEFLSHRMNEVRWERGDTGDVYTDGQIEPEVYWRAKAMIIAAKERARGNRDARRRAHLRAEVEAGAATLGLKLVPIDE